MKSVLKWLAGFSAALFIAGSVAAADELAPDVLVRNVTQEVLEIVRNDKEIQAGNVSKAVALVEAKVLPHFDFTRMTQLAMGRDWRQATPAQQKILTEAFRELLVRTYSKALTEYRKQTIEFKPLVMTPNETEVKVRTEIRQTGGKPIQLDYFLEKTSGGWKVYDIEVGGISLVTNYRSSFSQEVRANGIDGLIGVLQAKNRQAAAPAKAK